MQCPVCKNSENIQTKLHVDQFEESLETCPVCGTSWSVNHGLVEIVKDSQPKSFLQGISESVENDDYNKTD